MKPSQDKNRKRNGNGLPYGLRGKIKILPFYDIKWQLGRHIIAIVPVGMEKMVGGIIRISVSTSKGCKS